MTYFNLGWCFRSYTQTILNTARRLLHSILILSVFLSTQRPPFSVAAATTSPRGTNPKQGAVPFKTRLNYHNPGWLSGLQDLRERQVVAPAISSPSQPVNDLRQEPEGEPQFWLSGAYYSTGSGGWPYGSVYHTGILAVPENQKMVGLVFHTLSNTYGDVFLREGRPPPIGGGGVFNPVLNYSGTYCRAIRFQEY